MYHGLAGSSSGALFPAPAQFLTAGIIASFEHGAGGDTHTEMKHQNRLKMYI